MAKCGVDVNRQINARSLKWKLIRRYARFVTQFSKSKLLKKISESDGLTALHYAARRGDVEIVELLMIHGADTSVRNRLGRDVLSYCEDFPAIENEIERVRREISRIERSASEWKYLLSNAYLWFDFWCEPHYHTKSAETLGTDRKSVV